MKVILQNSYMSLGEAGEVVSVRPGYARNFLIPQKIAVSATAANLGRLADKKKEMEAKREKERDNSRKLIEQLEKVTVTITTKVSDDGKLFGSITGKHIETELANQGLTVDRRQIVMGQQIKRAGDYKITVKLVGGLKAIIPLTIKGDKPLRQVEEFIETEVKAAEAKPAEQADTESEEA